MKIKAFESICKDFGGYYECNVSENNLSTHVTLRTCEYVLFPDELRKIKKQARIADFKLQYIVNKSDGIGLQFIKLHKRMEY